LRKWLVGSEKVKNSLHKDRKIFLLKKADMGKKKDPHFYVDFKNLNLPV
jgi:hypothetical protein